MARNQGI